jgi:hypothetical protein
LVAEAAVVAGLVTAKLVAAAVLAVYCNRQK